MVTVGLLLRIEAKDGKGPEVEALLKSALGRVEEEETTTLWVAMRLGQTSFGVFDAFADDAGRRAHLEANGEAMRQAAGELFAEEPRIETVDVVAAKLP